MGRIKKYKWLFIVLTLCVAFSGVAYAGYNVAVVASSPGDQWHVCVSNTGVVRASTLRFNTSPTACPRSTDTIRSWNASGPTGLAGNDGQDGRDGATGPTGPSSQTTSTTLPVALGGWEQLSADGGGITCGVKDGAAYCWGRNAISTVGLGDGLTAMSAVPVPVASLSTGVSQVSAGTGGACAIQSGAGYCWGTSIFNSLGDGAATDRLVPVLIPGLEDGVTQVFKANGHSCAIKNGAAYCWGWNPSGAVGDDSSSDRPTPTAVAAMDSGVTQIAGGGNSSCAIKDAAAYCWGDNHLGQLGDGTTVNRWVPTQVNGMESGVTKIAISNNRACAIKNGAAYCWGTWADSATTASYFHSRVLVYGLWSGVTDISTSGTTCAVQNGAAYCWGTNSYGVLGDGTTAAHWVPGAVAWMQAGVSQVSANAATACAIQLGVAFCWGLGGSGGLGNGDTVNSLVPVRVL